MQRDVAGCFCWFVLMEKQLKNTRVFYVTALLTASGNPLILVNFLGFRARRGSSGFYFWSRSALFSSNYATSKNRRLIFEFLSLFGGNMDQPPQATRVWVCVTMETASVSPSLAISWSQKKLFNLIKRISVCL